MRPALERLDRRLTLIQWMVATVVALLLPSLWLLLRVAGKVGAV
jgi:hypothetical protein